MEEPSTADKISYLLKNTYVISFFVGISYLKQDIDLSLILLGVAAMVWLVDLFIVHFFWTEIYPANNHSYDFKIERYHERKKKLKGLKNLIK